MTIRDALVFGSRALAASSLSPHLDAHILLAHALNVEKAALFTHPETILSALQKKTYTACVLRARTQEPIAYITGSKEFFGLSFFVNKWVLVPRPETETLVECALSLAKNLKTEKCSLLDIGTGSGCIIISLAQNLHEKNYSYYGVDISRRALQTAEKNARAHGLHRRIAFIQSDLMQKTANLRLANNIIISANLPYISPEKYQKLAPCIKNFEPQRALLTGKDGLACSMRLLRQIKIAQNLRNKTVSLCMEIEPEHVPALTVAITSLWDRSHIHVIKDASGNERVLFLKTHV